jgi:hypothetical protein
MKTAIGGIAAMMIGAWLASVQVVGQTQAGAVKEWRTSWGDPDLQGIWTTWDETPLQAPIGPGQTSEGRVNSPEFAVKETPPDTFAGHLAAPAGGGMSQLHSSPVNPRRRSMVVDPPDGRIPILPGKAERRSDIARGDTWEAHSGWERCVAKGPLGRNLDAGGNYDKAYRILQTPGYVAILHEQVHDMRVIPMDGRPHVGAGIRLWHGDSRGRWEGQTLVIETTNFNNKGDGEGGAIQTETLRLVERYTRIDEKTLNFEVTIEDPAVFARPWTARAPHNLDPEYVIYEYACHEGNQRYMEGSLRGGRLRDAAAAAAKKTATKPGN